MFALRAVTTPEDSRARVTSQFRREDMYKPDDGNRHVKKKCSMWKLNLRRLCHT